MKSKKLVSRREFIRKGSIATGSALGALAFGTGLPQPPVACAGEKKFFQSNCGASSKNHIRVLVAYESYLGSTGKIAQVIGETLCELGAQVDIQLVSNVKSLAEYQAAVIGSSIKSSKWMPSAIKFVQQNKEQLQDMKIAYFLACIAMVKAGDKDPDVSVRAQRTASSYMNPVQKTVPEVTPLSTGLFAGVLDFGKLSFVERIVMKSKMEKLGIAEGDYRDWKAIRSWAMDLQRPLLVGS